MLYLRIAFTAASVFALTAAAAAKPVTLSAETNLRAAPGTKSEVVTLMPKGSAIEVGDCDAGWCKVAFGDKEGFAIARNLGEAPPVHTGSVSRPQTQADIQKLRRGYEQYFDDDGRNDQAADVPAPRQQSKRAAPRTEDNYYDDDDAPVAYAPRAYPPPPVYYSYYYPYPRVYYGPPRGYYYRRW
jgi:uncharacterized protein YraI